MTTYAKLIDNRPKILTRTPGCPNPTEEMLKAYAKENGYKPYTHTEAPNPYYTESFKELKSSIKNVWTPWELQKVQEDALNRIQVELDSERATRTVIACEGLENGIFCDPDARAMATGLMIMKDTLPEGTTWTDAADEVHPLTKELVENIGKAFVTFLMSIQTVADTKRAAVKSAENVDAVWDVISDL